METFAEVRQHMAERFELMTDEPFIVSFEYPIPDGERRQSIFLAEIQSSDGRRVLRVETPVAPLDDLDPEKCLRINLTLRVGYLAVGGGALSIAAARRDLDRGETHVTESSSTAEDRSFDIPLSDLDVGSLSSDTDVKRALANAGEERDKPGRRRRR